MAVVASLPVRVDRSACTAVMTASGTSPVTVEGLGGTVAGNEIDGAGRIEVDGSAPEAPAPDEGAGRDDDPEEGDAGKAAGRAR